MIDWDVFILFTFSVITTALFSYLLGKQNGWHSGFRFGLRWGYRRGWDDAVMQSVEDDGEEWRNN